MNNTFCKNCHRIPSQCCCTTVKTLTDEEIQEVAHGFGAIGWMGDTTYEFARAILRKAQEK
jgi:hypothetical protein